MMPKNDANFFLFFSSFFFIRLAVVRCQLISMFLSAGKFYIFLGNSPSVWMKEQQSFGLDTGKTS